MDYLPIMNYLSTSELTDTQALLRALSQGLCHCRTIDQLNDLTHKLYHQAKWNDIYTILADDAHSIFSFHQQSAKWASRQHVDLSTVSNFIQQHMKKNALLIFSPAEVKDKSLCEALSLQNSNMIWIIPTFNQQGQRGHIIIGWNELPQYPDYVNQLLFQWAQNLYRMILEWMYKKTVAMPTTSQAQDNQLGVLRTYDDHHHECNGVYLKQVFERLPQGVCVYDDQLELVAWNKSFVRTLKLPEDFLFEGRRLEDITRFKAERGDYGEGDIDTIVKQRMQKIPKQDQIQYHSYERRQIDNTFLKVRGDGLPCGGIVTTYTDITEQKRAEYALQKLASKDPLTNLANRRSFEQRLQQVLAEANKDGKIVGLLMLDLNRFKPVNDTYGHLVGDQVLRVTAERMQKQIRDDDLAARIGGDEFAIVLNHLTNEREAHMIASRLSEALIIPMELTDRIELEVGVSIGVGFYPQNCDNMEELINHADKALYSAKAKAQSNFCIYDQQVEDNICTVP